MSKSKGRFFPYHIKDDKQEATSWCTKLIEAVLKIQEIKIDNDLESRAEKMYRLQKHPFMRRQAENTQLFQVIHVRGDQLSFEAFTATGELYDAFTLTKQPGAANLLEDRIPDTPERLRPPVSATPAKKASEALESPSKKP